MVKQLGAGIVSEAHSFPVIPHGVDAQEVFSQEYDVVATLAQWRDMQFDGVDAIEEVLTECAFAYSRSQVGIGGGYDSHVHLFLLRRTNARCLPFLYQCKHFLLHL